MSSDSIYPEFLKRGIGKLEERSARNGELLGLFSALETFRRDLADQTDPESILRLSELYVSGLELFEAAGFLLVHPTSHEFELKHSVPPPCRALLEEVVCKEIKTGRFAWALRQNTGIGLTSALESGPRRVFFHTLSAARTRIGMFCGILKKERAPVQEIAFSLLSLLLGTAADALSGLSTMDELQKKILAASGTLNRALEENRVLARIPAESPNPVLRLSRSGRILYSNESGLELLKQSGWRVDDLISGTWMEMLEKCFTDSARLEFEADFQGRRYSFLIVPIREAGYANFYATDITARKAAEAEREKLIAELRSALNEVKTLSGLVPICSWCKKVRDDQGYWEQLETYIQSRSEAVFTHGICPECRTGFVKGQKPSAYVNHSFAPPPKTAK